MRHWRRGAAVLLAGLVATVAAGAVWADAPARDESGTWLAAVREAADGIGAAMPGAAKAEQRQKRCPMSFSVDYTLTSDYIWRGINNSEPSGEGREKLNHQMGIGFAYDTKKFGTIGGLIWLEWYGDQDRLTRDCGDHLQEVDYVAYWSYDVEPIATEVEVGWIGYQFPQLSGDAQCTHEAYVVLRVDDSKLLKLPAPLLNPYVALYMDVDDFARGCWLEFGVSHDFALAEMGCKGTPVLKDLTVTPSLVLGYDHRYLDKFFATDRGSSRVANLQWGLDVTYDLSGALALPVRYGQLAVTGFLKFSDAVRDDLLNDEFHGGVTLAWAW